MVFSGAYAEAPRWAITRGITAPQTLCFAKRNAPFRIGKGASCAQHLLAQAADHLLLDGWSAGLARLGRKHGMKDLLERHHMGTGLPAREKTAITRPLTIRERDCMIVVTTSKVGLQLVERDSLRFVSVLPCLLDLADQVRVHTHLLIL